MTHNTPEEQHSEVEGLVELRICTKTGVHTCRLGSIHLNEREKGILENYLTTHSAKVREDERERIRDTVNEEAKRSFYVGVEMWRNQAYKAFRTRIFNIVFGKPNDIRPCQFNCGNNLDWIVSNDDGDEFAVASAVQCGHCGQVNTSPQTDVTKN